MNWQSEIRELFAVEPKAAERILAALDTDTLHGGQCSRCVYGHAYNLRPGESADWFDELRKRLGMPLVSTLHGLTPLERFVLNIFPAAVLAHYSEPLRTQLEDHKREVGAALRAECVQWLAENGTAVEPAVAVACS